MGRNAPAEHRLPLFQQFCAWRAGLGGFAGVLCCAWCRAVNLRGGVIPELRIVRKQNKLNIAMG